MKEDLILASSSPRRKVLLSELGIDFSICPAEIEEKINPQEDASQNALRLSREKAEVIARGRTVSWILASDTVVALGTEIYGKPEDEQQAKAFLRSLSGKQHFVHTGVTLLCSDGSYLQSEVSSTEVCFIDLDKDLIDAYVQTGEPFGKAGAYSIQGLASRFVNTISGSFTNVVGLDICLVRRMLKQAGLYPKDRFAVPA